MSRWDMLPISETEQAYLASTTTSPPVVTIPPAAVRKILGGFIRQEISEAGQHICYYRTTGGDMPVPYLCDMGCCNHGCCTVADLAAKSNSMGWAIGLFCLVIAAVVVAVIALLTAYCVYKYKDKKDRERMAENSLESGSVSQISGPTDFYLNDNYYHPYGIKPY